MIVSLENFNSLSDFYRRLNLPINEHNAIFLYSTETMAPEASALGLCAGTAFPVPV